MRQTLVVNHGEYEFTSFQQAEDVLQQEYGYQGFAWDMVVASDDFEILCDFLNSDGVHAELE
ncbi:hypothetical protein ABE073_05040 [Lederbergia citrisecunda]|uniref:hypothetical protein n=1 Tax=Lederbergia citrisecunda TaxID=2833583 RepID=UPI003D26FCAA